MVLIVFSDVQTSDSVATTLHVGAIARRYKVIPAGYEPVCYCAAALGTITDRVVDATALWMYNRR